MKKTNFPMGNDPRTNTPREAKISGIRIDIPQVAGATPSINIDYRISTQDLQGNELITTQSNSFQMQSKGPDSVSAGVQKTDEKSALEAELITVLEKSGVLEKLVNLDINKFLENEQQNKG